MSDSVLSPNNVRHDAAHPRPLRRTESDRDLAYLIRTLLRLSAQRERELSSPTLSGQPVARSQDLLGPLRQFQRRVAAVGSVAHLVAKDPGGLLAMSRRGDCGRVRVAFEVDDLQAAVDRLAADGYGLVGGIGEYEHSWRMAYVRGPEGIIVSLAERIG
jgi:catechol 2,3-dioxygenase-like lactoylglutathione lyase family enzyme